MTIARKLNLLVVMSITILVVLLGLAQYSQNQVRYFDTQLMLVQEVQTSLLELRRYEKDFRFRLDMKYAQSHAQLVQQAQTVMAQLDPAVVGDSAELKVALTTYQTRFKDYVTLQNEQGLTPDTGVYGALRQSVHAIESALKQVSSYELLTEMLLLRRHEKDFMLRKDMKYAELFEQEFAAFDQQLKAAALDDALKNQLLTLVTAYDRDFQSLVAIQKKLDVKGQSTLAEAMSASAREVETLLADFVRHAKEVKQSAEAKDRSMVWLLTLMSSVLLIGFILWIRIGIVKALTLLTNEIVGLTQRINFKQLISYQGKDEIGVVAQALNGLLVALDHGLTEVNHVVSSLAAGHLQTRVTDDYRGDLATLKQGVNYSADSIAHVIRDLSSAMHALQEGRFDAQINVQAQGEYGAILITTAAAMKTLHEVIGDINRVMSAMNEGDFEARVVTESQGDLLAMKVHVNNSMDRLAMAVTGITAIVSAQANGDLTKACTADFKGQLLDLQRAINQSSAKLKEVVAQAMSASNVVNVAASKVAQGSSDLSARVQSQAAALQETSATMNEMTSAVQANTNNARKVADLAHEVQHQARDGAQVMQQTIDAMQSIRAASDKISDIVTLINSIAFQTNLLALNAAVEAARAGDQGRGFAVVASEVRALAGKSAEAAKDIKTLIDDSVARIHVGTQLVDKSGEMLLGITNSIEHVADMVEEIATASNEQSIGINQVHQAMSDIDRVTQENAALVGETSAAADSLGTQANQLRDNMAFFNTGVVPASTPVAAPRLMAQTVTTAQRLEPRKLSAPKPDSSSNADTWSEF